MLEKYRDLKGGLVPEKQKKKNIQQEKSIDDDPVKVKELYKKYKSQLFIATSRKERLEDLLRRNSSSSWSLEKRKRIEKRLVVVIKDQEDAAALFEQFKFLLERLNLTL